MTYELAKTNAIIEYKGNIQQQTKKAELSVCIDEKSFVFCYNDGKIFFTQILFYRKLSEAKVHMRGR